MISRRRYMGGVKKLPYDAEVEYLENTGTEYITLPVSFKANDYFAVGGQILPDPAKYISRRHVILGNPNHMFRFFCYGSNVNTTIYYTYISGTSDTGNTVTSSEVCNWELSPTGTIFNGVVKELQRPLTRNMESITVFCNNGEPTKFMSFYVKDVNGKIYDLIPVRVGTTGYMYDKVSGALFGNEGSGAFIVGPDK